ncbi:hypothetical protein [Polaromonas sp.]|uniref:hypothetical protein n=1 Tax=Polaromonas sp. TaxID=1869339 RepID=UPI003569AD81
MKTTLQLIRRVPTAIACIALLLLAADPARAALDAPSAARLQALSVNPAQAGDLIYRGATFAQGATGGEPLFRYERRIATTPMGLEAAHLTRDPKQKLIIAESAQFNARYELQRFNVQNQQSGYSGEVQVSADGRQLQYSLNDNGTLSTAEEKIDAPALTGPSTFGFILAHWSELAAGRTLPVRFIVLKEKTSYGFDIRAERAANGQAAFILTPSNWLIRRFIAPLHVVFEVSSKTAVRYEGRVPPMQSVAGKLVDLDAQVDYTPVTTSYR